MANILAYAFSLGIQFHEARPEYPERIGMAYNLPFSKDVTQLIGRYANGYPSDRIKDMMARVERIEFQVHSDCDIVEKHMKWSEFIGPCGNCEIVIVQKLLAAAVVERW